MNKNYLLIYLFTFTILFNCEKKQAIIEKENMLLLPQNKNLKAFWIDKNLVSVADFRKFITATKYITEAEKFGDAGFFDVKTGKWSLKKGCTWEFPMGKDFTKATNNHPVTQVSWNDAVAYATWAKKRLPTIEEYNWAAKNADETEQTYAWGEKNLENGQYKANFWQGSFPMLSTVKDGYQYTSPIGAFAKSKLGMTDMGGNVWQWLADWSPKKPNEKLQAGGSFLCDPAICHGFKIGNTSESSPETSLMHVGFRCVRDKE